MLELIVSGLEQLLVARRAVDELVDGDLVLRATESRIVEHLGLVVGVGEGDVDELLLPGDLDGLVQHVDALICHVDEVAEHEEEGLDCMGHGPEEGTVLRIHGVSDCERATRL